MALQGFDYADLGGGVNVGAAPAAIQQNQFVELRNWYPYETRLRRRGGVRLVTTNPWSQLIQGIFPLKLKDGTWVLLVGGQTKFGKLGGSLISDLSVAAGTTPIADSGDPWCIFQYKNQGYALRRSTGNVGSGLYRLSDSLLANAGIPAPASAPTLADGGAGTLSAATYRAVTVFGNLETEYLGNPSPVSNALALGASKKIDYSGIAISTSPFVNMRRVYRTLPDQQGAYFFVFQINDNVTTTFTGEQVAVADLGRAVSFRNGLPPELLRVAAVWNERVFASDGTDLFYSETLMGEGFDTDSVIPVFPDDGHVLRAIHAFGDRLIIGKTNKVHYLVGSSPATFALHTLSDKHGCMSHHSMQSAEGNLFWFGSGKTVFRSNGTSVLGISDPYVYPYLKQVPDDQEELVVGAVFPKLRWYVLSIPQEDANGNTLPRITLVYNYRDNSWTVFDQHDTSGDSESAPSFLADFFDANYGHLLYSTHADSNLYNYADETYQYDDVGVVPANQNYPVSIFETKSDDFGYPAYRKAFGEVWFLIPKTTGGVLDLTTFRDEVAAASVTRTVSFNTDDGAWKAFKLQRHTNLGSKIRLRTQYKGPMVDIDKLHFEVDITQRRPPQPR